MDANPMYDYANEVDAVLATMIASVTWLVRKGYLDLALEMRDEFMREWEIPRDMWNNALADTVDYVHRKGSTPEASISYLQAVAVS